MPFLPINAIAIGRRRAGVNWDAYWKSKFDTTKAQSILVQGDSTGNGTTEWVYLFGQYLATIHPSFSMNYRLWNDTHQCYDLPVYLQAGSNDDAYVTLPGTATNVISTENKASLQITGDIDMSIKVSAADWDVAATRSLIDKFGSGPRSFNFSLTSAKKLYLWWTADGTTQIIKTSTVAATLINGQSTWFRVTLDVDNDAGGYDVKFYQSSDGVSWTQLGDTIVGASTTAIATNTTSAYIGGRGSAADLWACDIYKAYIRDGINGKVVASFEAGQCFPATVSSIIDGEGNIWALGTGITKGNGSPLLQILNASTAGAALTYSSDETRFALQTPIEPVFAYINYSHNEGADVDYTAEYEAFCEQILAKYADVKIVCVVQNPQVDPEINIAAHATRCAQIKALAIANNYGYADVYNAFVNYTNYATALMADGCHPNEVGSILWRDIVIKYLNRY